MRVSDKQKHRVLSKLQTKCTDREAKQVSNRCRITKLRNKE